MTMASNSKKDLVVFLSFLIIGFALFFRILDNVFLSDDYLSLHRVLIEKRIIYKGIFRPLIDVSFYFNYLLSGLNPSSYYLVNILIHCTASFMVYRLSQRFILFAEKDQFYFALLTGFLFLIYPFHNESIVWLTGRLSSIACLCGLLILVWSLQRENRRKYFLASVAVYLFALTGYESIILLPFIILVLTWEQIGSRKSSIRLFIGWSVITIIYIVIRLIISDELTSGYGARIYNGNGIGKYVLKFFKTTGRLLLPPMENSSLMVKVWIVIIVSIVAIHFFLMKQLKQTQITRRYVLLIIALLISMALPASFGISTRTSEGDRLLYFPSVFLCMILACWIFLLAKGIPRWIVVGLVSVYFLFFLQKNNERWEFASETVEKILEEAESQPTMKKIFVNIPEELEGALVFREGFNAALRLKNIDTAKIVCINYLDRLQYLEVKEDIIPERKSDQIFIYPVTLLKNKDDSWKIGNIQNGRSLMIDSNTNIFYWNKQRLNQLSLDK